MTIGQLETRAGIADREAYWEPFAKIPGTVTVNGKTVSRGLQAGIEQLRYMAAKAEGREG